MKNYNELLEKIQKGELGFIDDAITYIVDGNEKYKKCDFTKMTYDKYSKLEYDKFCRHNILLSLIKNIQPSNKRKNKVYDLAIAYVKDLESNEFGICIMLSSLIKNIQKFNEKKDEIYNSAIAFVSNPRNNNSSRHALLLELIKNPKAFNKTENEIKKEIRQQNQNSKNFETIDRPQPQTKKQYNKKDVLAQEKNNNNQQQNGHFVQQLEDRRNNNRENELDEHGFPRRGGHLL